MTKANRGIESAIIQLQEKLQVEAKKNNKIWGKIIKAVDVAMAAKILG